MEDKLVEFANLLRQNGVRVSLADGEQMRVLGLYRAAGYREVPDYNGNPYAAHWFEKTL